MSKSKFSENCGEQKSSLGSQKLGQGSKPPNIPKLYNICLILIIDLTVINVHEIMLLWNGNSEVPPSGTPGKYVL